MSQYTRELDDGCLLRFGWDNPLDSYFIMVHPPEPDEVDDDYEEELLVDIGARIEFVDGRLVKEVVGTTSELASKLADIEGGRYSLTDSELARLAADRQASNPPTMLQQRMTNFIDGVLGVQDE